MVSVRRHSELQGSMRRSLSHSDQSGVYQSEVFWLWRVGLQRLVCPLALLPGLRNEPAQRPQRGEEQGTAWAKPSGRGWGTGLEEPSIHRAVAPAECQPFLFGCTEGVALCDRTSWLCSA